LVHSVSDWPDASCLLDDFDWGPPADAVAQDALEVREAGLVDGFKPYMGFVGITHCFSLL